LSTPSCKNEQKNASKLHRARSHVTHKKILVEANALYDTKFAKTIVKKVFVNFFSRSFLQSTDTKKKEKYQQRLKKKKNEEKK